MILLRSLLFIAAFYLMSVLTCLIMVPFLFMRRRVVARALRVWGGTVTWLLKVICGVRVEVRGVEHRPTGPALVAAKHQGMFDIFGQLPVLPDACFILKKELTVIPFFGWYAAKDRMIVVDREGHSTALKKLVRDARDRMKEDRQIVIFPEGTRSSPGEPTEYKPGVAALYRELDLPCSLLALNTGVHWPRKGLKIYPGTIVFQYLPPIPAGLKRAEFMREMTTRIDTASNALLAEGV